jgi:hypothetical protein
MPRPFRGVITGRSSDATLIRADKDRFVRQLYARLGPAEFWRRRLVWLATHRKWKSYDRLVAYLKRVGIEVFCGPP